ncbi:MAG: hypothetical protein AAB824_01145, partial [Patescibacteria group bacterium]
RFHFKYQANFPADGFSKQQSRQLIEGGLLTLKILSKRGIKEKSALISNGPFFNLLCRKF